MKRFSTNRSFLTNGSLIICHLGKLLGKDDEPVKNGRSVPSLDLINDLFKISWDFAHLTTFLVLPEQTKSFKKRIKREFRKTMDHLIRSHAFHKFTIKLIYFVGFIISVILATLLYFDR